MRSRPGQSDPSDRRLPRRVARSIAASEICTCARPPNRVFCHVQHVGVDRSPHDETRPVRRTLPSLRVIEVHDWQDHWARVARENIG